MVVSRLREARSDIVKFTATEVVESCVAIPPVRLNSSCGGSNRFCRLMYSGENVAKSIVSEKISVICPVCRLISAKTSRIGAVVSLVKTLTLSPLTPNTANSDISRTVAAGNVRKQSSASLWLQRSRRSLMLFKSFSLRVTLISLLYCCLV